MQTTLNEDERRARAKLAADTRWGKRFDWETSPIKDCEDKLAEIRAEGERGGLILQRRMSVERVNEAMCYNPSCKNGPKDKDGNGTPAKIDIGSGRFAGSKSRINNDNGMMETAYACSAACFLYLSSNFKHSPGAVREPISNQPLPETVLNEAAKTNI